MSPNTHTSNSHTPNSHAADTHTNNTHSQRTSAQDDSHAHNTDHAGRWYVAAFSEALAPGRTLVKIIAAQEIVLWRARDDGGPVQAASAVCPHWGGPLGGGAVDSSGVLTCPWHGWQFRNGYCLDRPRFRLPRYLAHDDGILLRVRLPWDVEEITAPLQARPAHSKAFWFDVAIQGKVAPYLGEWVDSPAGEQAAETLESLVGQTAPSHH